MTLVKLVAFRILVPDLRSSSRVGEPAPLLSFLRVAPWVRVGPAPGRLNRAFQSGGGGPPLGFFLPLGSYVFALSNVETLCHAFVSKLFTFENFAVLSSLSLAPLRL